MNYIVPLLPKNMIILPLTLALSSLLMSPISARPLLTDFTNTMAQNFPVDEPFCYMKTPDGKTVDLGKLCEKQPSLGTSQTCIPGANIAAKVSIATTNYDGNFFSGQVLNQGCKIIKNVKVNYEVLDESGNLIDNGFIYAEPVTLAPGTVSRLSGRSCRGG